MNANNNIHINNRNTQIGNICMQFSVLELFLANAIWSFLGLNDEVGLIVTGNLDVEARVNMAVALSLKLDQPKSPIQKFIQYNNTLPIS